MNKETLITEWHISDFDGRRSKEVVLFQGKKLSHCNRLRAWVRWDKYLIRYFDLLWFAGFEGSEFMLPPIDELKDILEKYIKDKPIVKLADDAENFTGEFRMRWFYSKVHGISKQELDLLSDELIENYFNN